MEDSKKMKGILKWVTVCGGAALLLICGLFYASVSRDSDKSKEPSNTGELQAEAEYVEADSAMAESTGTDAGKQKKKIKIVEVIEHPLSSIFPYLIDWGTQESYNEHLLIGYDGLQYMLSTNGNLRGDWNWTSVDGTRESFDELGDYDMEFIKEPGINESWRYEWWRKYENTVIPNVSGYFEYVGYGKGLYTINLDKIVDEEDTSSYGIRYEMTAMDRKGSEAMRGEYTVQNPVCYLAKDYQAASVSSASTPIKSWTKYNYNLSFDCEATEEKNYRIYHVASNALTGEYFAHWDAAKGGDWTYGYDYQAKGNYQPKTITPKKASDLAEQYNGLYLRITSTTKQDKVSGVEKGYFKLYDADADASLIGADTVLYDLTFEQSEQGFYVLSDAGIQKEIEADSTGSSPGEVYSKLLFSYVGKGKGTYDISFIYAPGDAGSAYAGTKYAASIVEVCFNAGRYALASGEEKEKLYVAGTGDYSKLVTSIDCRGIEYDAGSAGYTQSGTLPVGLCMGITESGQEIGSWVFHAYEDEETHGVTKADDINSSTRKIYVTGQNRKKCYYEHVGFSNNDWFKLLIYMSNDDGTEPLAWQDYQDRVLTGKQIKQKYSEALKEFDETYEIEVVQRKPSELTVEDVEDAALLYFSEEVGVNGLEAAWNTIQSKYNTDLPSYNSAEDLKYKSDISTEALFAIYRCCMYDQTAAIMFGYDVMQKHLDGDGCATKNLGKMLMMLDLLDKPARFAEFIDGYEERNLNVSMVTNNTDVATEFKIYEAYSMINPYSGEVTVYKNKDIYNAGTKYLLWDNNSEEWKQKAGTDIEPQTSITWDKAYFRVPELKQETWGIQPVWENISKINGWKAGFPGSGSSYLNQDVEDDWTWYTIHDLVNFVRTDNVSKLLNVWKILHNRSSKETSDPVVIITNADGSATAELATMIPVYYFYIDAYSIAEDSDFNIDFKINWVPEEVTEPNDLVSVVITDEDTSAELYNLASPEYKTDYTYNAALSFKTADGELDPTIITKDFEITVTDSEGKEDSVIARFVVREAFNLN